MKTFIKLVTLTAVILLARSASAQRITPYTFAHISDTHIAESTAGKAHDANLKAAIAEMNAMSPRPAFVIHTGDITEMGEEAQFRRYKEDIRGALMPVKNTPGNHETRWADQSINRFTEELGDPNISFKVNGVRFIGFNAAIWLEHHGAISGDTRRWIVSQLKLDPPGTPAVLFAHQPPMYPDNVYMTGDVELWEAIAPYNVRLFLNGHGHIFKTWTVNGVLCHMTKGMMNEAGGYSLYEVDQNEIRVYDKLNGQTRTLKARAPLTPKKVNVAITSLGSSNGVLTFQASVASEGPSVARVQYLIDHHERPADANWTTLTAGAGGIYSGQATLSGLRPGRHTLAVRAVDSTNGTWITTAPFPISGSVTARRFDAGTALQGPSAVDESSVYVGGWDGKLYAVDRATMQPKWSFPTGGAIISRPDVDESSVYVGSTDRNVYALHKATGGRLWTFSTGGPIQGHLTVADGAVFAASGDHNLYAIEAATGARRWAYPMQLHAQARPAVADGKVYIGAWDNGFYALDVRTGTLKWRVTVGSIINYAPAVTSPCVIEGRVILTAAQPSASANVWCLDAATGKPLWKQRIANGQSPYGSPTSDGQRVYCAALDGSLWALSLEDGSIRWTARMPEIAYDCSPVVMGRQIVCNTLYGGVQGRNAANGSLLWDYKTGAGLQFAWPTVAGDTVYQPSMDGTLTAVTLPTGL